ncbi:RCC1 domain-containing protein [Methanocella arvoryzae]|uniref:Predicted regulator of chromosome condensation n=1 Tax=Methanocella arvoryzae (strain DSM 22066 / NBRC 105507 / MRE50) TaxID=351160 RepID=Q0W6S3_METAR|nr:regulator of chromosome condensation [Methanocella arvoryzae]CAJ35920.1 predicted regulator of chromosome condensation [Methanocella arvoryzae MRE50]
MILNRVLKAGAFSVVLAALIIATVNISVADDTTDMSRFVSLQSSGFHTLAIGEDGSLWAWGSNGDGACGVYSVDERVPEPVRVEGLSNVTQVACYFTDSMALLGDGTVWMWGGSSSNFKNDSTELYVPVQVPGLTGVKQIACGQWCSLALKDDGTVWAWGNNEYGHMGDGTKASRIYYTTPVQVPGLSGIKMIACNAATMFVVDNNGTVWAWGKSHPAMVSWNGLGNKLYTTVPVQVIKQPGIVAITANDVQLCIVTENGKVWKKDYASNKTPTPDEIKGLRDIATINSGYHMVALEKDGSVYTWGKNDHGQIGDGTITYRTAPYKVNVPPVKAVFSGQFQTFAIGENGDLWGWGGDEVNQLGDGGGTDKTLPVKISFNKSGGSAPEASLPTPIKLPQSPTNVTGDQSKVISPGFDFGIIALLGCLFIVTGLITSICRRKD